MIYNIRSSIERRSVMPETDRLEIDLYDCVQNEEMPDDVRDSIVALILGIVSSYGEKPSEVIATCGMEYDVVDLSLQPEADYIVEIGLPSSKNREHYRWPTCRDIKYMTARLLHIDPSKIRVRYRLYTEVAT